MTAPFELLGFTGAPAGPDVAVLELEGTFTTGSPRAHRRARLLVENAESVLEVPPVATAPLPDGAWRGTYAVPLAQLQGATFALAVGRDLLLELPVPDVDAPGAGVSHHIRLAREANELRARFDAAESARASAEDRARQAEAELAEAREGRETLEAERDLAVTAATEAAEAREKAEAALAEAQRAADERVAAATTEASKQLEAARTEHERRLADQTAEAERKHEEELAADRARASVMSHELRAARAEVESLRRELASRRGAKQPVGNGAGEHAATDDDGGDDDEVTEVTRARRREPRTVAVEAGAAEPWSGDGTEGFRVLTPRAARPRHRAEDEPAPSALPPGAAATGARTFEPADGVRSSSSTRLLAVAALAIAILAAILVVVLRVGLV